MIIAVLGGVGIFLLGMTVMTDGLKAMAGSALGTVLTKAAATPLRGAFWGAFVTLLVQSSSATTMTTIGLVSAGLLSFPQGLSLVLGANVGTTGTAWLVALIGVRVSLTTYALPMIFVGALLHVLGKGRTAAAGGSLAGFALVLYGLTSLQQGMNGLSHQLHPSNLPSVLGAEGVGFLQGLLGLVALVGIGFLMTTVMQSSTAAIAVTLSAHYAGAIGLDQACALIIGQNIGTATSSAMAAIGASVTAKRLALAYVLFKIGAAAIALVLFPVVIPLLFRVSHSIDGVTLLAAYHTAYNVVGVAVFLPLITSFTRIVERILPDRGSPLTRELDPSALETPIAAVAAVRHTVARSLGALCDTIGAALQSSVRGDKLRPAKDSIPIVAAGDALQQAQDFISGGMSSPLESKEDRRLLANTLHALDRATRLAEMASDTAGADTVTAVPGEVGAVQLCVEAMRNASLIAGEIGAPQSHDEPHHEPGFTVPDSASATPAVPTEIAIAELERCAKALDELQGTYRSATLKSAAHGELTASEAMARVDGVRRLAALARNAWRSSAHLVGRET